MSRSVQGCALEYFMRSADCNGISAGVLGSRTGIGPGEIRGVLAQLVRASAVTLAFGSEFNPHIKAFAAHSIERQLQLLDASGLGDVCVYPSPKRLAVTLDESVFVGRPFSRMLRLGHPQLAPVAFEMQVLSRYRQDPRYLFQDDGTLMQVDIRGEFGEFDSETPDSDKVGLQYLSIGRAASNRRVVVALPRYLAKLSPSHQQYWASFSHPGEFSVDSDFIERCFGRVPRAVLSIYDAFLQEQAETNRICKHLGIRNLYRRTFEDERPDGFGPITIPTSRNYYDFVHLLDKLLSENIDRAFFGGFIELEATNRQRKTTNQSSPKGTLRLLEEYIPEYFKFAAPELGVNAVATLRAIRRERQRPAHVVCWNDLDTELEVKQDDLMLRAYRAVRDIRLVFCTHPLSRSYKLPEWLERWHVKLG